MSVFSNTPIISTKHIEHHIERHYEIESNKDYYLQQLGLEEEFFEDRLDHCLNISDTKEFINFSLEEFGTHEAIEDFEYLHYSTFVTFFRTHRIDIPRCFGDTKSVRRKINEIDFLKFNNYFMRHGKKAKCLNYLLDASWSFVRDYQRTLFSGSADLQKWRLIFLTFNNLRWANKKYLQHPEMVDEATPYGNRLISVGKRIDADWSLDSLVLSNIHKMLPMFSFYIYRVDKKIFKNTRGKSGKFTFIWKYVAPYKRNYLVMSWLMKELRLKPGRSLPERVLALLQTLVHTPKQTWIWRVRKFSYNYVYSNCRRTLAESYRTSTK